MRVDFTSLKHDTEMNFFDEGFYGPKLDESKRKDQQRMESGMLLDKCIRRFL